MDHLKILILERQDQYRELLDNFLREKGYCVYSTGSALEAIQILDDNEVDIAFVDQTLSVPSGVDMLRKVQFSNPFTTAVAISSNPDPDNIKVLLLSGASDVLLKPFGASQLNNILERAKPIVEHQMGLKITDLNYSVVNSRLKEVFNIEIIGSSLAMKNLMNLVSKVAEHDSTTVLISGESGTGKELVAKAIHALSARSDNFFHCVNCSAVPETLFESEFFGHEKGAFTGAEDNTTGWFEIAQNGTLFLDEISELPLKLQAKFLRVLENKVISKVGAKKSISLDQRIIAATNQDLENMVENNMFRVDLFHRLTPFTIIIPPLRERKDDIPELINFYVKFFSEKLGKKITRVDDKVHQKLQDYSFPGNVRELKNIIERAMIINEGEILRGKYLKLLKKSGGLNSDSFSPVREFNLQEIEIKVIAQALRHSKYNKSQAARLLKISRQALDRKILKYKIDPGNNNA